MNKIHAFYSKKVSLFLQRQIDCFNCVCIQTKVTAFTKSILKHLSNYNVIICFERLFHKTNYYEFKLLKELVTDLKH